MPSKVKAGQQPCPACREPCAVEAIICPHCRTTFTQDQIDSRVKAERDRKKTAGWGCFALVAAFLLIGTCGQAIKKQDEKEAGGAAAGKVSASAVDAKADAIALYKAMLAATSGCDDASQAIPGPMQRGDTVAAYRAADRAKSACLSVSSDIKAIEVPTSLADAQQASAKKALDACETAYLNKWAAADKLADIIDGAAKPSDLAELEDTASAVQAGQMLCAAGLMSVATELGATTAELGIKGGD